jgi:hypothetical protein
MRCFLFKFWRLGYTRKEITYVNGWIHIFWRFWWYSEKSMEEYLDLRNEKYRE